MIRKLPVLILNPHNRCNCRCVMCDIWKRDATEELSRETFNRQLASMERLGVEWVVFSGGEALMHSDLFGLCAELRKRNIRVTILSSGLLTKRFAAQIVEYADDLIVSLDGPAPVHDGIRRVANAFAMLAGGVESLRALRPDFPVAARCTVQRDNCAQLTATVEAARDIGLNSVSFLAADIHSDAFNRSPSQGDGIALRAWELPVLEAQIETLIASGDCGGFVLESPTKLRRIVRHFRAYLGLEQPESPICNAPWTSGVVEADGTVRPCFFHPSVGRLGEAGDLEQIINGPEAAAFRAGLDVAANPTCRQCVCSLNWRPSVQAPEPRIT